MNVRVFGVSAVGSLFGARLVDRTDAEVSLIARGPLAGYPAFTPPVIAAEIIPTSEGCIAGSTKIA